MKLLMVYPNIDVQYIHFAQYVACFGQRYKMKLIDILSISSTRTPSKTPSPTPTITGSPDPSQLPPSSQTPTSSVTPSRTRTPMASMA